VAHIELASDGCEFLPLGVGGDAHELEFVAVGGEDAERILPDGAGGPEEDDPFAGGGSGGSNHGRRRRCGAFRQTQKF
jgi:hypothetical protein